MIFRCDRRSNRIFGGYDRVRLEYREHAGLGAVLSGRRPRIGPSGLGMVDQVENMNDTLPVGPAEKVFADEQRLGKRRFAAVLSFNSLL